MSHDSGGGGGLRSKQWSPRDIFWTIAQWMWELGISRAAVSTYACVWALTKLGRPASAKEVARRTQKSERSVRRHSSEIAAALLWRVQSNFVDGRQVENTYLFLPHPAMTAMARNEPHVLREVPGEVGIPRGDSSGSAPLSQVAGRYKRAQEQTSSCADVAVLSEAVRRAVASLAESVPTRELERVLAGWGRAYPLATRETLARVALEELSAAIRRGNVRSAPALLRTILANQEERFGMRKAALPELQAGLERQAQRVRSARTGEGFCFTLRAWERARRAHDDVQHELGGTGPSPTEPELANTLLTELARSWLADERAHSAANASNDGFVASKLRGRQDETERAIDAVLRGPSTPRARGVS